MLDLSFYAFDIGTFDLLIGQPLHRLIREGQIGRINVQLGKLFQITMPITRALNAKTESSPKPDPLELGIQSYISRTFS
jgi:hypothetical protein